MPECKECGNRTRFWTDVEGSQLRIYHRRGTFDHVDHSVLEVTGGLRCDDCGSTRVVFEDEES